MILDAAVSWLVNSINNPAIPLSNDAVLNYLGGGRENESGVTVTRDTALGLSTIWRAINMLSSDVAKLPLDIYRRTADNGKEKAKDHKAYKLLRRRPGRYMSAFVWKKTMIGQALLHGNAFSWVRRVRDELYEIVLLPPSPQTYSRMLDGKKLYVTHVAEGTEYVIPAAEVVHIHGLSWDGQEGLDVLTVMANTFGLEIGTHQHAARFFKRGTMSSGFITAPRRLADQEVRDLRDNWTRIQTGLANLGGVGVLHGGLDFKALSIDPEKAQLIQARDRGIVEIANVFNVPPHKLGSPIRTSYASLEAENRDYLSVSLDPWLILFEEECYEKMLTPEEREADELVIEFNRDALMSVDYFNRINGLVRLKEAGVLNSNQIAAIENLPTMGDQGDRRYVPANWVALDDDGLPAASSSTPPPQRDDDARQAILRAIEHAAEHLIGYEAKSVEAAAGRERNFLAWMDEFYGAFQTKLLQAILHDCEALAAVLGRHDGTELATRVVGLHVKKSSELLMDLAGSSKAALFADAVKDAVTYWPRRAKALIEGIERMLT